MIILHQNQNHVHSQHLKKYNFNEPTKKKEEGNINKYKALTEDITKSINYYFNINNLEDQKKQDELSSQNEMNDMNKNEKDEKEKKLEQEVKDKNEKQSAKRTMNAYNTKKRALDQQIKLDAFVQLNRGQRL